MGTHSFATLELSPAAYEEIRGKLAAAGYHHVLPDHPGGAIDMHGLAVTCAPRAGVIQRDRPIGVADIDVDAQQRIEAMKSQALLVLVALQRGLVRIPVSVIDDFPVGRGLGLEVDGDEFVFALVEGPNVKLAWPRRGR